MPTNKYKSFFEGLRTNVVNNVKDMSKPFFEPTGALEPIIKIIGETKFVTTIINNQGNNKGGKTALGAAILSNTIWDYEPTYFGYPNFMEWPFLDNSGNPIKRIRIVGSSKNVSDTGPIRTEILKWWPRGRYTEYRDSKAYYSKYISDTGWLVDVMTFNQSPKDFEGPLISFHWVDEPPGAELIGAFTSRHSNGGIILFTQTPERAAPMLDCLSDLKDKGMPIIKISSKLDDNSITSGTLNSTGTKRGLMTDEQIDSFKKSCPPDQYNARVLGIGSEKEGKIYKDFSEIHYSKNFDIFDPRFLKANCYTAIDMHEKFYPFITFWAVFPPNDQGVCYHVCYNEWPTFSTMNAYYDDIRKSVEFNMTIKDLSQIIKIQEREHFGYNVIKRGIDPRFASKNENILEFRKHGIIFDVPKAEKISTQRDKIRTLMSYDKSLGIVNIFNEPSFYITPNCKNMIRMFQRHYWEDPEHFNSRSGRNTEVESQRYKEGPDTARIFESMIGDTEYFEVVPKARRVEKGFNARHTIQDDYLNRMSDICIFKD